MMVLSSMDLSLVDLKRAGADPYDLEPLAAASPDFARKPRLIINQRYMHRPHHLSKTAVFERLRRFAPRGERG
jgi:hypothetical protein